MHTLIQDIRYAWRSLCKTRGFTIVAVATLALGIAANTGVFSIIHAVLFRALPYSQPQRLVVFHWYGLHGSDDLSAPAFLFLRERAHSFTQIGAIYPVDAGVNLAGAGTTRYVRALHVSQEFFFTVNANPVTGRTFSAADDQPSAPATAVLSYGMWERLFHRAPSALGRQILVDGEILVVVGVMPREFRSYPEADIWIPLQLDPAAADAGSDYRVVGRLKPGIDLQQARSELAALSQEYRLSPNGKGMAPSDVLTVENLQDFLTRGVHRSLMVLWGAVLLVLMIVCTNLALLVSVRALNKNHELAVRAALGAGRIRLLRIFVIESMILVLIGAVLGVILAKESLHFVVSLAPANLPIGNEISIDRDVLLFAVAVSVTSGLFFGLVPAFRVFRVNLDSILRQGPHGIIPKTEHARSARLMVAIQTALSLILLSGAVLLMKSFLNLQAVPPGFDPNRVWVAQVSLRASRYATTSSTVRLLAGMLERLRSYPGVDAVASIDGLPLEKGLNLPIYPAGSSDRIVHVCWYRIVSPDYFRALRIQQISGRTFMDTDDGKSAPVAIVNETLARRWWQHNSTLGHSTRHTASLLVAQ
jgi:putative ABC transport system permease protein